MIVGKNYLFVNISILFFTSTDTVKKLYQSNRMTVVTSTMRLDCRNFSSDCCLIFRLNATFLASSLASFTSLNLASLDLFFQT